VLLTPATTMQTPREPGHLSPVQVLIPSDPAAARRVQDQIEQCLQARCRFSDKELFGIKLALEEALVNAIKHGNQLDRTKQVEVIYHVSPDRFEVQITDQGPGFDPADVPDPTDPDNLERPCGRGLLLMRHYMTEVAFNDRGNCVTMSKVLRNGRK
jgi:serine/threonine-protein kinase RsbW